MILNTPDFNLKATLESGQVFGFQKKENEVYEGFISNSFVRLRQNAHCLEVETAGNQLSEQQIINFFHLDFDLTPIYEILAEHPKLNALAKSFKGLRIIRQDSWEALACFIISSNNNIKRIQKIRKNLAEAFSDSFFGFPKADQVAKTNELHLRKLGLGYRAPFLMEVSRQVTQNPDLFAHLRAMTYQEAKEKLMELKGIGEKVSDCVLLFGLQKYEAFPVDVWIWRAMRKLYFRNRKTSEEKIRSFAQKRWGINSGYIQQYLYYGIKNGGL